MLVLYSLESRKSVWTSEVIIYTGGIAKTNTRNAISTFLEVALFESDIFPIVDHQCGPVIVLLEPEAAVKKTDIPDVAEVPCVRGNGPYMARKPLVVFFGVQQSLQSRMPALHCDPDILELNVLYGASGLSPDNTRHFPILEIGETIGRCYVLEGDIPNGAASVRTFGHTGDVRDFHEDRHECLFHSNVFVVEPVDDTAVIRGDAYAGFTGTYDSDVLEPDVFE